ncbi:MAG: Do family serine endopeptidase [Saprospiraceae bacterium]
MKPTILSQFVVALVAAALVFGAFRLMNTPSKSVIIEHVDKSQAKSAVYTLDENGAPVPLDFTGVAQKSLGAVVHIINTQGVSKAKMSRGRDEDFFRQFFQQGDPRQQGPSIGSGSGVIINPDGYIVTNNHVVKNAEDLEVTLNDNRKYKAKLIGTDPQTDVAIIKIEEKNLPSLKFSNSDDVKIGQWVLAIGNPFNLNSTVTAGIVSAKGRNIDLFDPSVGGIESFIQTDAAINPGNSGGALVDLNGNLIGINTAIASQTGSYNGYGFAVPANLAGRVAADLIQFGTTQRGYLGVTVADIDSRSIEQKDLKINEGAYIASVRDNSAAQKAGIKAEDVVTAINDRKVSSRADLMEIVGSHRIGDKLNIKINRKGDFKVFEVTLKTLDNSIAANAKPDAVEDLLGADLKSLDPATAKNMGIEGGVQVVNVRPGLLAQNEIEEGFIITRINRKPVSKPNEALALLKANPDGSFVEGYYPGSDEKITYNVEPK